MKTAILKDSISLLLMLLFGWVGSDNLLHFEQYVRKMQLQVFSPELATVLAYFVPGLLLLTFFLLFIPATRKAGLLLSSILLFTFCAYISLVLLKVFGHVPCSCISVFENMSWKPQLIFTCSFLVLSVIGFTLNGRRCGNRKK